MIRDYLLISIKGIRHRKLRAVLTILGIIIGIAAIVSLVSVSQGLESSISGQFEKMGSNRLFLTAKGSSLFSPETRLTQNDMDFLAKLPYFKWVNGFLYESAVVEFGREKKVAYIMGGPTKDLDKIWGDYDFNVEKGRMFSDNEKYSVVVGSLVENDMFDKKINVNNNIKIKNKDFKVIGILKSLGNPEDDNILYIPLESAREVFDKPKAVGYIDLVINPGFEVDDVAEKTGEELARFRGQKSRDKREWNFEIITPTQLLGQLGNVLLIVQVVLIGIASISLIVGSIGIMNSMFTSVMERTADIGIMKSVGAKRRDIMALFLVESGFLGLLGGVLGVALGMIIAKGVEIGAASAGFTILKVDVSPQLMLAGITIAVVISLIAGGIPASKASKMNAVDALRY